MKINVTFLTEDSAADFVGEPQTQLALWRLKDRDKVVRGYSHSHSHGHGYEGPMYYVINGKPLYRPKDLVDFRRQRDLELWDPAVDGAKVDLSKTLPLEWRKQTLLAIEALTEKAIADAECTPPASTDINPEIPTIEINKALRTQVWTKPSKGVKTSDVINACLDQLAKNGDIRIVTQKAAGRGRPSRRVVLNNKAAAKAEAAKISD